MLVPVLSERDISRLKLRREATIMLKELEVPRRTQRCFAWKTEGLCETAELSLMMQ